MKAAKTPQQKKYLSYTRDHLTVYNSDKGSRRSWPRKEAQMARAFRHKVAQTLRGTTSDSADHIDSAVRGIVRKKARKWAAIPLGQAVAYDLQARVQRHGLYQAVHAYANANGITFPSKFVKWRKYR